MASALAASLLVSACGSSGGSTGKKLVIGDILFDTDAYQIAQQK
jgi:hypothetical protein